MSDIFFEKINNIVLPKTLLIITGIFIVTDILTGYLKAIKNKKISSSVSRDGYIKKIGYLVALLFGFLIDIVLNLNFFLKGTSIICITTEGMSIFENLSEIGVKLPFMKYFKKMNDGGDEK